MKEKKLYICEICGVEYNEKTKAERCEAGHIKPKKIVDAKYYGYGADSSGFPCKVIIELENGEKISFKRGS